jgi:hypothetical protein
VKTCTLKNTIHQKFTALNSVFRRTVLEQLCTQGLGVGALVNLHLHGRTDEPILAIVREINWDNIHMRHLTHLLSKPMMGEIYQRKDVWERFEWQGGREMEVVSPVSPEAINPPADWLSGEISTRVPTHNNPLTTDNKAAALWELKQSELGILLWSAWNERK